jgi:NAD(P)-dependent dehydrogenase (short-subunit alcohol dehydrogenase family)
MKLGIIGLGRMGSAIARRLIKAGHDVTVYNRTRSRAEPLAAPVALHIHERVSTQAILKIATRTDVTRDLFADPQLDYHKAVQFYRHEMDWSNRLIFGDSLQVMASLAQREDLAGKVQMIYVDPPYGIRFGSNFQPTTQRAEFKDRDADLTREPEMIRAYRDTCTRILHICVTDLYRAANCWLTQVRYLYKSARTICIECERS